MVDATLARLQRLPLRDQIYGSLLEAIVQGTLAPGARLRDQDLAAELGVSRTPVREALRRLEDEGLIQSFPGALTRVAPLDIRDAREAVPVIAALHAVAAREATPRLATADFETLEASLTMFVDALESGHAAAALQSDDAFHATFVRVTGNGELTRSLDRLMPRIRRLELARFTSLPGRQSIAQHSAILRAARAGDALECARLTEINWLTLGELLAATFTEEM